MVLPIECGDIVRLEFSDHFQNYLVDSYEVYKEGSCLIFLVATGSPDAKEVQPSRNAVPDILEKILTDCWCG